MTIEINSKKRLTADSMLQVIGEAAGDSRILTGYRSAVEAEAIIRAKAAGYTLSSLCPSGEFGIDLMGESGINGGFTASNGFSTTSSASCYTLASSYGVAIENADAALHLDVNGSPRRAAAQLGLINIKPTVGTVSGFGAIPVCRTADTVSVTARTASECKELLSAIAGMDEKDPLTHSYKEPNKARIHRVGFALWEAKEHNVSDSKWLNECLSSIKNALSDTNVETVDIPDQRELFTVAHSAWNTILCAELWSNLARYDGVHFGKRAEDCHDINELYVRSRSEGFGKLTKAAILYGSESVADTENGSSYQKAVCARNYVNEKIKELFETLDAIIIPACSAPIYTVESVENGGFTAFNENFYTALPSLLGLPTVTALGAQIIGKPYSDIALIELFEP